MKMKDMYGNDLRIGDTVRVNTLEAVVEGFEDKAEREFVVTQYGNFSVWVVKLIPRPSPDKKGEKQ
jgi:hypothetical protein